MWCFLWMFFFEGVLCVESLLVISPNLLTAWKGSCVLIPCQIVLRYPTRKLSNISLIWWYDPVWEQSLGDYNGVMLYNGSTTSVNYTSPASPLFQDRVRFTGDLQNTNCSLKISQVQESDNGTFGARLYGFVPYKREIQKWFLSTTIIVSDSPPKPRITFDPQQILEERTTYVTCSVSYHCPDEPVMVTLTGLENGRKIAQRGIKSDRVVQTKLSFTPTWKDHRKQLACLLKSHNGTEISRHTVELDVKYLPKGVQLTATPGITVREGMKLSLKCLVNSSNPAVSYQWKKDDAITHNNEDKMEFHSVQKQHSGRYKCTAANELGAVDSNELTIDVQNDLKDVQLAILNQFPIKEGDIIILNCSVGSSKPGINVFKLLNAKNGMTVNAQMISNLMIFPAKPGPITSYKCEACNDIGCTPSPAVTVDVYFAPKKVRAVRQPSGLIDEGSTVKLSCEVGRANPEELTYIWYKDTDQVMSETPILTIQQVTANVSGNYHCEAKNSVGTSRSSAVSLDVRYGPREIHLSLNLQEAIIEGKDVSLRFDVKTLLILQKIFINGTGMGK